MRRLTGFQRDALELERRREDTIRKAIEKGGRGLQLPVRAPSFELARPTRSLPAPVSVRARGHTAVPVRSASSVVSPTSDLEPLTPSVRPAADALVRALDLLAVNADIIRKARRRPALVLDIDDTVLCDDDDGLRTIPFGKTLYEAALHLDMLIFFVTAREDADDILEYTNDQLRTLGMGEFTAISMRPAFVAPLARDMAMFKMMARETLCIRHGASVACNVGDQWTDHTADKSVRQLRQLYERAPSGDVVLFLTAGTGFNVKLPHSNRPAFTMSEL